MSVKAGNAYVELSADNRKLKEGLADAKDKLKDFSDAASAVGTVDLALGGATIAAFAKGVSVARDFAKEINTLKAVTRASADEMKALTAQAEKLGQTTAFTAANVAAAQTNLARGGFNVEEIQAAIAPTLQLSTALGIELPDAADTVVKALSGFGLKATDAQRMVDLLALTTNSCAMSGNDMSVAFRQVAPTASAMGVSAEEAATALTALANAGLEAGQQGTVLRNILLTLQQKSADIKEIFDVDVSKMGLLEAIDALKKASSGMGDELISNLSEVFNKVDLAGVSALLAADNLAEMKQSLDNAAGAGEQMAATMQEGIVGAFTNLESATDGAFKALGDALTPALVDAFEIITKSTITLTDFIKNHQTLARVVGETALVVGSLGAALTTASVASKAFRAILSANTKALQLLGITSRTASTNIDSVGKSSTKAATGLKAATVAADGLKVALRGIGAALAWTAAITALVAVFDKLAGRAREMREAFEAARDAQKAMRDAEDEKASEKTNVGATTAEAQTASEYLDLAQNKNRTVEQERRFAELTSQLDAKLADNEDWSKVKSDIAAGNITNATELTMNRSLINATENEKKGAVEAQINRIKDDTASTFFKFDINADEVDTYFSAMQKMEDKRGLNLLLARPNTNNIEEAQKTFGWTDEETALMKRSSAQGGMFNAERGALADMKSQYQPLAEASSVIADSINSHVDDALASGTAEGIREGINSVQAQIGRFEDVNNSTLANIGGWKSTFAGVFVKGADRGDDVLRQNNQNLSNLNTTLANDLSSYADTREQASQLDIAINASGIDLNAARTTGGIWNAQTPAKTEESEQTDDAFAFLDETISSANEFQLGMKKDDEEYQREQEEAAKAQERAAKEAADAAADLAEFERQRAEEEVYRKYNAGTLTSFDIDNLKEKSNAADAAGINNANAGLEDLLDDAVRAQTHALESFSKQSTISSRVADSAISAAFTASQSSTVDLQRQSLTKMSEISARLYDALNYQQEIINQLS